MNYLQNFDEKFEGTGDLAGYDNKLKIPTLTSRNVIKQFLTDTIKEIEKETIERCLKALPEERAIWSYILLPWNWSKEKEKGFGEGFNSAIQQSKDAITNLDKENKSWDYKLGIHKNNCPHCLGKDCECMCHICRPDLRQSKDAIQDLTKERKDK
jgi:hypothetical protein